MFSSSLLSLILRGGNVPSVYRNRVLQQQQPLVLGWVSWETEMLRFVGGTFVG